MNTGRKKIVCYECDGRRPTPYALGHFICQHYIHHGLWAEELREACRGRSVEADDAAKFFAWGAADEQWKLYFAQGWNSYHRKNRIYNNGYMMAKAWREQKLFRDKLAFDQAAMAPGKLAFRKLVWGKYSDSVEEFFVSGWDAYLKQCEEGSGEAGHGPTWPGPARPDMARHGPTWPGPARQDEG